MMCDSSKIPPLREQISEDCYTEAFIVKTPRCGSLNVHVQGDLSTMNPRKPIFLTVHDVGATYLDFVQFAAHPCMTRVCEKSVFLHIEVPGQAYNAPDLSEEVLQRSERNYVILYVNYSGGRYHIRLSYKFPSMDDLAQDMADVLHYFKVPYCVALGEGAGANILARFTMNCPELVLGSILIHCSCTEASLVELFNYQVVYWYQGGKKSGPPPMEHFLVFHKFGKVLSKLLEQSGLSQLVNTDETSGKVAQGNSALSYAECVRQKVNRKNSSFYIQAYLTRSDISGSLKKNLKTDILLVTSSTQVHADTTQNTYSKIDPAKAALLKLDDVEDILSDAQNGVHTVIAVTVKDGTAVPLQINQCFMVASTADNGYFRLVPTGEACIQPCLILPRLRLTELVADNHIDVPSEIDRSIRILPTSKTLCWASWRGHDEKW